MSDLYDIDISDMGDDPTDYYVDPYIQLHNDLCELAEAVASCAGRGLPAPDHVGITIQVASGECDAVIEHTVDTLGRTVIGVGGEDSVMLDKTTVHFAARGKVGSLDLSVFQALFRKAEPAAVER